MNGVTCFPMSLYTCRIKHCLLWAIKSTKQFKSKRSLPEVFPHDFRCWWNYFKALIVPLVFYTIPILYHWYFITWVPSSVILLLILLSKIYGSNFSKTEEFRELKHKKKQNNRMKFMILNIYIWIKRWKVKVMQHSFIFSCRNEIINVKSMKT